MTQSICWVRLKMVYHERAAHFVSSESNGGSVRFGYFVFELEYRKKKVPLRSAGPPREAQPLRKKNMHNGRASRDTLRCA